VTYEWFQSGPEPPPLQQFDRGQRAATRAELQDLFQHLESELDDAGFLFPPNLRPTMVRNLRSLIARVGLTEQEVRTVHGVITGLCGRKWQRKRAEAEAGDDAADPHGDA
jgi:tRNA/rRNA methyltransferase